MALGIMNDFSSVTQPPRAVRPTAHLPWPNRERKHEIGASERSAEAAAVRLGRQRPPEVVNGGSIR
jgi:hypothetical protein